MRGARWGGSEELWAATAEQALRQGHQVLASVSRQVVAAPRVEALRRAGAVVHARRPTLYGRFDPLINRFTFPLRKVLAWRPDVALVSQGSALDWLRLGELDALFRASARGGPAYVLLSHGNMEVGVQNAVARARARDVLGRAKRLAYVSPQMVALAERQVAARLSNAAVICNPVNLSSPDAVPWPAGETARFAHVARAEVYSKGPDILMEALSEPRWRDRDWRLTIYGRGPAEDYLKDLARFYGLADRTDFPGHTDDVRAVWERHHLLTLPSRTEGLPLAMVEAMICGRPALVTDVGGVRDWLEEPANGFVAEAPNARYVGAALERAWASRSQWEAIGRRAREMALARLDPDPGATLLGLLTQ